MIGSIRNIKCWGTWYKVKIVSIDTYGIFGNYKLNKQKFRKEKLGRFIGGFPWDKIQEIRTSQSK